MMPETPPLVEPIVEIGTSSPDDARQRCLEIRATVGKLENAFTSNSPDALQLIGDLLEQARRTFDSVSWVPPTLPDSPQEWEASRAIHPGGATELSLIGPADENSGFLSMMLDANRLPRRMTFASPGTPWQVVTIGSIAGGGWTVEFAGTGSSWCLSASGVSTAGSEIQTRFETALKRMNEIDTPLMQHDVLQHERTVTIEPFDILCGRLLADSPEEIARWSGDNILPGLTQKVLAALTSVRSQPDTTIADCPRCGRRTKPGAKFCGGCGTNLTTSD